jgi:hypothetical protein
VPIGGNANTPKVSKYTYKTLRDEKAFKGIHIPTYKQVVSFGKTPKEDIIHYSHSGG